MKSDMAIQAIKGYEILTRYIMDTHLGNNAM